MDHSFSHWIDFALFPFVIGAFFFNAFITYFWHQKVYQKLGLKAYKAIQRIHLNEIPRLGGVVVFVTISLYVWLSADQKIVSILKPCLISQTPLILMSLREDLFHDVRPLLRLIALLASGALFVRNFVGPYPFFDGIFFEGWLKDSIGLYIFYSLALTSLANGSNLTDGVNGLCSFIFLSILSSLLFLAYQVNDETLMMSILIPIILLMTFLIFNYPFGKIFLGDLGAYTIAFLAGMLTIIFFGRHPQISPWIAVLILIYPMTEVAFSIVRRIYQGKSIFMADTKHLHIIIFSFFRKIPKLKRYANSSVTPLLSILWIYPLISIPWVYKKPTLILFFILLFWLIYGIFYFLTSQKILSRKA